MKKILLVTSLLICLIGMASSAFAFDSTRLRQEADSQFRIAEKAYNKAVKDYGENFEGMPEEERTSACTKMRRALYDNRTQYNLEDLFAQMKFKKQIKQLEDYSNALGCTN